jgi:hypothetical protein
MEWTSSKMAPGVIIYAGVSHHGLLLLDQLSLHQPLAIPIIFTDGCLTKSLLSNGGSKLLGRGFIVSPAEFRGESTMLPSYEPIGEDAYTLASKILRQCDNCTREEVAEYLSNNKNQLSFEGKAGKYDFGYDGNNNGRDYFIYEMKGGKLIPFVNR